MSFDAYYYSFEPTGNAAIDSVLEIVAQAGHGCHSTENWRERYNGQPSYEEQIQATAIAAAASLAAPAVANGAAELPPLPEPFMYLQDRFTPIIRKAWADQMNDYARAAVLAERAACADIVDNADSPDCGGWNMNHIAERIRARN